MALQRIEIDKDKPLNPGDRIEMHFKTTGMVWLTATQIALIEWRIGKRDDWEIISNSLPENNRVIFTILIKEPPKDEPKLQTASVTSALIAASILAVSVGILIRFTLGPIYQIIETPAGKIAVAGTGLALPIIAGVVLIGLLKQ